MRRCLRPRSAARDRFVAQTLLKILDTTKFLRTQDFPGDALRSTATWPYRLLRVRVRCSGVFFLATKPSEYLPSETKICSWLSPRKPLPLSITHAFTKKQKGQIARKTKRWRNWHF